MFLSGFPLKSLRIAPSANRMLLNKVAPAFVSPCTNSLIIANGISLIMFGKMKDGFLDVRTDEINLVPLPILLATALLNISIPATASFPSTALATAGSEPSNANTNFCPFS